MTSKQCQEVAQANEKNLVSQNRSDHPGGCVQSPWNVGSLYYNDKSNGETQYNSWASSSGNPNFNIYCSNTPIPTAVPAPTISQLEYNDLTESEKDSTSSDSVCKTRSNLADLTEQECRAAAQNFKGSSVSFEVANTNGYPLGCLSSPWNRSGKVIYNDGPGHTTHLAWRNRARAGMWDGNYDIYCKSS